MASALKEYTAAEVAKHNTLEDLWLIIDNYVYDLTKFVKYHPGGKSVLLNYAGKESTQAFYEQHRVEVLKKYDHFKIGKIAGAAVHVQWPEAGAISKVPHAENPAWQGFKTPYFKESHFAFRAAVRKIIDELIIPNAAKMEENNIDPSSELMQQIGKTGYMFCLLGPGPWLKYCPVPLPGGVKPEEFDAFHELIAHEEQTRIGMPGLIAGLFGGFIIGNPVIFNFGSQKLMKEVAYECCLGKKRICLAISEAFAGSDVANIQTTAKKTADGKHYIVNGTKKWITSGSYADYFVTAVRTGGPGAGGMSVLLIERSKGVNTEKIKTAYSAAAGTSFIMFDDVLVPVENLLHKENRGFEAIMYNFNHERWSMCVGVVMANRGITEECFKWAHQRKVFGKALIEQPVIRAKIGAMIAANEPLTHWLEHITYQMTKMSYKEAAMKLAGPISLLKYQSTRTSLMISDNAVQIFGGRGITRTGMGSKIESFQRSIKFSAVLGGSEEIMLDLGARMAIKSFPKSAKL